MILLNVENSAKLEKKIAAGIFGIFFVAGLFFGIGSLTGAVISFSSELSGFLGVILFIVGILGLFFSLKNFK